MLRKLLSAMILLLFPIIPVFAQEDGGEAFHSALAAYQAAATPQAKLKILTDFAEAYPDYPRVVNVVLYEAVRIYEHDMGDPAGAADLVETVRLRTADPGIRLEAATLLAELYGLNGSVDKLRSLVGEQEKLGELSFDLLDAAAGSAIGHKGWEYAIALCDKAAALATPEAVLKENPQAAAFPPERLTANAKFRLGETLAKRGWILFNLGRVEEAESNFKKAEESTVFDFLGVSQNSYAFYRAGMQLSRGELDAALETIAPNALYQGRADAKALLEEIYAAKGGKAEDLGEFKLSLRAGKARAVADFTLADYSGVERRFSELCGKVTVLVFWFPT